MLSQVWKSAGLGFKPKFGSSQISDSPFPTILELQELRHLYKCYLTPLINFSLILSTDFIL